MRRLIHHQPGPSADPENTWISSAILCLRIDNIQFQVSSAMSKPGVHLCISHIIYRNILRFFYFQFQCVLFCFCHSISPFFDRYILSLKYLLFYHSTGNCAFIFSFDIPFHSIFRHPVQKLRFQYIQIPFSGTSLLFHLRR